MRASRTCIPGCCICIGIPSGIGANMFGGGKAAASLNTRKSTGWPPNTGRAHPWPEPSRAERCRCAQPIGTKLHSAAAEYSRAADRCRTWLRLHRHRREEHRLGTARCSGRHTSAAERRRRLCAERREWRGWLLCAHRTRRVERPSAGGLAGSIGSAPSARLQHAEPTDQIDRSTGGAFESPSIPNRTNGCCSLHCDKAVEPPSAPARVRPCVIATKATFVRATLRTLRCTFACARACG